MLNPNSCENESKHRALLLPSPGLEPGLQEAAASADLHGGAADLGAVASGAAAGPKSRTSPACSMFSFRLAFLLRWALHPQD